EDESREGEAFALKELVDVAWRHAVASCDLGDPQVTVAEIRADVGHDHLQSRGGDAASLRNRPAVARGADGCGNEIMHVADREPLQFWSGEWQSLGDRACIGDEQVQRLGAMRNETYRRLVEPAKQQCDRLTRHPNANEAPRRWTRDGESAHVSRRKQCIAVPEYQVSVALTRHAAPPNIDGEQEIVPPVRDGPPGPYCVAQTRQRSRHDGEARQRPLGQLDVERIVGQRFEWFDRFELGRQKRALMKVKVPYRLGTRRFRYRVSDSGEGRWTLQAAVDEGVPAPVIASALFARFSSRGEAEYEDKLLSALRFEFGGHVEKPAG